MNISKTEIVAKIVDQIWESSRKLRHSLNDNNLHLLLFLISAYKDNILDTPVKKSRFINCIKSDSFYKQIFIPYSSLIERIPEFQLNYMVSSFKQINRLQLENNFKEVFEHLLNRASVLIGKKSRDALQPLEITRLVLSLAELKDDAHVYNPFAGFASFGIMLNEGNNYYGQEINDFTWAIGQLRLKAYNRHQSFIYRTEDSVQNWELSKKYDLVVSNPPYRLPIPRGTVSLWTGDLITNALNFIVDRGLSSLSERGKLITVFPLSFLFTTTGRYMAFKKRLIDNNLIDTIIELPGGLLSYTSIPVCIIVFSQEQKRPGYVRFIDATKFYKITSPRTKVLDIEIVEQLIREDSENEYLRYVDREEIHKNEFNLGVARYFLETIKGVKLSDFARIISGPIAPVGEKMRQVQIKELKDDVVDCELVSDDIKPRVVERGTFKVIEESCVLLAVLGNSLKPTYFEYSGDPICISRAVLALRINQEMVHPIFLINEFHADYIKSQIEAFSFGNFQRMLSRRDLNNILFRLPQISEQRAKVSAVKDLSSKIREIEMEKQNLLRGIEKQETESSTSLSHVLGKPLLSIGSSLEIIKSALSNLNPNWKDYRISQNREFTLFDAFESISKNIKNIQELADRNTSLISVSKFELFNLQFLEFLKEFVKDEKKSLPTKINLDLLIHDDIKRLYNNQILIRGNNEKLTIVMNNFIDNAKRHAFSDSDEHNKIKIEVLPFSGTIKEAKRFNFNIDENKSYVEVRFSNTGLPFPKDFTLSDYKRKNFGAGKNNNRGLGGYEVNEILKVHNEGKDALNIITKLDGSEYSSTVAFVLPIIQNYE